MLIQIVMQFQNFYSVDNYNGKEDKRNKRITEVYTAPLILFDLSFGRITPAFELVITAGR